MADWDSAHDVFAEQGVIGTMLASDDAVADMSRRLRTVDFYRPAHATLFATIMELFDKGIPATPIAVLSRLIETGDVDRVGGAPYVAQLRDHANAASLGYYAATVKDRATDRALLAFSARTAQLVTQPGTTADRLAAVADGWDALTAERTVSAGRWAAEVIADTVEHIEAAGQGRTTHRVVPTGFSDLDRLLGGGLLGGQLIVIAGRPGTGKSTLGLDIVRNATVRAAMTSMMVSLEMSTLELMMRAISAEARIPLNLIRTGALRPDEWDKIVDHIQPIDDAPMIVFDDPSMSLAQIRAEARRLKTVHDLRLIVVDYLQLMTAPPKTESRQQFVADLSRGLKIMGKELDVPVIAMSQLNRNPETRQDRRPSLGDLRESGAIEQDADVVILLHNPAEIPDSPRAGEMDFLVAKHRNGPTATITVANQLHLSRFVDMAVV